MKLPHIDLTNPDNFLDRVPVDWLNEIRETDPVYWHDEKDGPGFWCITKHSDLQYVSMNPQLFSSERRGTNMFELSEEELQKTRVIMLNMDPPQHVKFRRIVQRGFTPNAIAAQRSHIQTLAKQIVDKVAPRGECEFVADLASELPLQVICELMGVPLEDRHMIYALTNRMIGFDDPELQTSEEDAQIASAQIFGYGMKLVELYKDAPPETNLVTKLVHAQIDGEKLSELEFCSFFLLLLIAGNETTRTVTTHGMRLLIEHPDQLTKLNENPALIPQAVEEILRYEPAVIHFRRTATQDLELRGKQIRQGDKVIMWYHAANRDPEVFERPDEFDITREDNRHVSFGKGEHYCLGANLARLELNAIFAEILRRLKNPKLAAPPRRMRGNFVNGVKEMRISFTPEVSR